MGNIDAALRRLEQAIATNPRHIRALTALGALHQVLVACCTGLIAR